MVNAVMMVSEVSRTKRDRQSSSHPYPRRKKSERSFSATLEHAAQEYEAVPLHCLTTVYGRDSKMQNFFYEPREYHY